MRLIKNNARITIKELAEQLNISTRAVEKNIAKLKTIGILERIGSDKGGHWKINK
ncbi:HTH domain-containing protein [Pedobacter sp. BS3]|uniref:HTH domain-containing protein n=1 Tax=Pedobacter sp. BS3 TaxID=2567937 RepID=UPI00397AB536